jgi:iron complex outermembrane recepter protein
MRFICIIIICLFCELAVNAQTNNSYSIEVKVVAEKSLQPLVNASILLLNKDSIRLQAVSTDSVGKARFLPIPTDTYFLQISMIGYKTTYLKKVIEVNSQPVIPEVVGLQPEAVTMQDVTINSKKPFVQFLPDKTVINPEASITNAGASVMDVLEKSPGITIGRDGSISMKGKPAVMVLIDGKQTQLNAAELQAYLAGINASQIESIELIENPGAKYDAAGNAGIINIKTKKNKQKGFNGSLTLGIGQGFYHKNNTALNLNYRMGKVNVYLNYGSRGGKERMNMYTLRKYFNATGADSLLLQQPNITHTKINAHNLKVGVDYFLSKKTTIGTSLTGNLNERNTSSYSTIDWMSPAYVIDSTINTEGTRTSNFKRGGINLYARHSFSSNSELTADVDYIRFDIDGGQEFFTQLSSPGSPVFTTRGIVPSSLKIVAAKLDYSIRTKNALWEAGLKTATTRTDNLADYFFNDGNGWVADLSRSNHFLYDEDIHAAYASVDMEKGKWHWQAGLRYELTSYKANQLGNAVVKDSVFDRKYASVFPTTFVTYASDSNNSFTLRMGRRIDRPQFQNLNPFIVTINKYTFEGGNPFIRPQYTWNAELMHTFKQVLTTSISYSYLKDYFSQIFVIDSNSSNINKNVIIYTRGNIGRFQTVGVSATVQLAPKKWWNLSTSIVYNHKIIEGVVWKPLKAVVNQVNISLSSQFQLGKGWSAELSGYYLSNSQIDLQESLTPQGEMGLGIAKQIWKNKATIRFAIRDLFYTQNYSGYSNFQNSDEPFTIKWDSRVARLSFSWRFGKALKAVKRTAGGAAEEAERVGTGN